MLAVITSALVFEGTFKIIWHCSGPAAANVKHAKNSSKKINAFAKGKNVSFS